GGVDLRFGVAISSGHFLRRAKGARDPREHIRLRRSGMRRGLGAEIFLRVVQRVLNQGRVLTGKGRTQLRQVFLDGPRGGPIHDSTPRKKRSTKSRVWIQ